MPPDLNTAATVVLDTNIWIDLLVFGDPLALPIGDALAAGAIRATISASCREELRRVLDYPQFARFAIDRDAALARVDALTTAHPDPDAPPPLPQCRDRDDQKFIVLAQASGAQWLVSKDKAVLKLAKRMRNQTGCTIATPAQFGSWLAAAG